MPATVNVNMLTVVHAASSGMAMSFPDVCKTPTPAGPVPIPYPNIAQSSDTADPSTTVKVDGNPILLKSSNLQMSSGDEAGSAMGVVSSKIKGKALPINASFDVKVDGKNVFRLTDPMQTNAGSGNAMNPAEVQAGLPEGTFQSAECEKVKDKKEEQSESETMKRSGMLPEHFDKIKSIAKEKKVIFYFRSTDPSCQDWIRAYHAPKPHKIFLGNTIVGKRKELAAAWLKQFEEKLRKDAEFYKLTGGQAKSFVEAKISGTVTRGELLGSTARYASHDNVAAFFGVVGGTRGDTMSEPLKSDNGGVRNSGRSYLGKWVTGDYDIFEIIRGKVPGCEQIDQNGRGFSKLKVQINETLGWDAIQHGPQGQWVGSKHDEELGAPKGIHFPNKMKEGFNKGNAAEEIKIEGRPKGMKVFSDEVTIIAPGGVVFLETSQDTFDALKCRECDKK